MIEFIPQIIHIVIPLTVSLVAAYLFRHKNEIGFALMSAAFVISAIPAIVNLALGGPRLALQLIEQGYTAVDIGLFNLYLFILSVAFEMVAAVLIVIGLLRLSK